MVKYIGILFTFVLTSFYFFPFEWKAVPGINTKMAMAAVGLCVYLVKLGKERQGILDKDMFILSLLAASVSFIGLFSVFYNNTPDYAYATYLISMWVWMGAAYLVICCIRWVHGNVSVPLLSNYLIAVCVFQCAMALWIDSSVTVKQIVDAYINQGHEFLDKAERLYGIGAALDVAGSRFAAVLVILAFMLVHVLKRRYLLFYLCAFAVIAVVGNMIARTTTVGVILAICYLLYKTKPYSMHMSMEHKRLWRWFICIFALTIPFIVLMYQRDLAFQKDFRFAFEGFFSLVEEGEWNVSSNDRLMSMYVFPETLKTWIIGDGYFSNPKNTDPYFTGPITTGYYMNTDVGYLRFIFYFGIIGLAVFSIFMCKAASICFKRFTVQKELFGLILLVHFIVWFKVSTDIFLVFAPFLCINKEENEAYMKRVALKNP